MKFGDIIPSEALRRLNPGLFDLAVGQHAEGQRGNGKEFRRDAEKYRPEACSTQGGVMREAELHEEIFDECRRRGWIALHGSMAERTCRTLGEPDFVILAGGGRVLFVECKTRAGKLSPAQAALKHHAEKLGHAVHVVRSMEEFLRIAAEASGHVEESP